MMFTNSRLFDERFDGHRFCFYSTKYTGKSVIKDTLGEFGEVELPNNLAELLATMLNDLHELQMDKKRAFSPLKSLIDIAENSDLDKDVLMTCIKYGMDYKKEVE